MRLWLLFDKGDSVILLLMIYCLRIQPLHRTVIRALKSISFVLTLLLPLLSIGQLTFPYKTFDPRTYGTGRDVWSIGQASDGTLYFGTSSTLARYDGERWDYTTIPGENSIFSIEVDSDDNRVYVGAGGRFGYFNEQLEYTSLSDQLPSELSDFGTIWDIISSSHGIYFRSTSYIFRYHQDILSVIKPTGNSPRPFDVIMTVNDTVYTHIREVGLATIYDGQLTLIDDVEFDLKTNVFLPHPRGVLIGTRYDGLYLLTGKRLSRFVSDADSIFKENHIYHGVLLKDGNYALATLGGGVLVLNSEGNIIYRIDGENYGLLNQSVNYVYEDLTQGLWLGLPSGLKFIDKQSPVKHYKFDVLEGYTDFALFDGRIYFGTDKGVYSCDEDGKDLVHVEGTSGLYAKVMVTDSQLFASNYDLGITFEITNHKARRILDGTGWAITRNQSDSISYYVKLHEKICLVEFDGNEYQVNEVIDQAPYNVVQLESINGGFFGYSISAGLFSYHLDTGLRLYKNRDYRGLTRLDDKIVAIGTKEFYIWNNTKGQFETAEDLNELLPDELSKLHGVLSSGEMTCVLYYQHNQLTGEVYKNGQSIKKLPLLNALQGDLNLVFMESDHLYIGTNETITRFDFSDSDVKNEGASLSITSGISNNQAIPYQSIPVRFDFTIDQVSAIGDNLYRFQLKGLSDEWSLWSDQNYLDFANLEDGKYELTVEGLTPYRETLSSVLHFKILPPWYRTTLAFIIYVLTFISLVWLYLRFTTKRIKLQNEMVLQKTEAAQRKELESLRSEFFARISHDLRTPVTLILGQIDAISSKYGTQAGIGERVDKARRNIKSLSRMIDDLFDLSTLQSDKRKLTLRPVDIIAQLKVLVAGFQSLVEDMNLSIIFKSDLNKALVSADIYKLEKVFNNLISNAIKFADPNTTIEVRVDKSFNSIIISVFNIGRPISEEDLPFVFDQFYQASSLTNVGRGLGLAIAKEIIDMHSGEIEAISNNGKTTFKITLEESKEELEDLEELKTGEQLLIELIDQDQIKKHKVLVVEDNLDLQKYLEEILSVYFNVKIASNTDEAWLWLKANRPSLIISDVMMPGRDGFEFFSEVKADPKLTNIPGILLTAKTSPSDKMKGLKLGVDDYIFKPFQKDELIARVGNLIANMENRARWMLEEESTDSDAKALPTEDEEMVREVELFIQNNLRRTDLTVAELAHHVSKSERQFYRKLSAATGLSPANFIMEIRLNHARNLLVSGKIQKVSQLAYEVGISTPHYLSVLYEKRFGKRPSEYLNR